MADTGNSATLTLGTSGFTGSIIEIGGSEETRAALENSHLGTTVHKTYTPDDLIEPGEFTGRYYVDGAVSSHPSLTAAAETATITYPLKSGQSSPATLVGTGFFIRKKHQDVKNGELMVGEFTFKWDGETSPTYTAGS